MEYTSKVMERVHEGKRKGLLKENTLQYIKVIKKNYFIYQTQDKMTILHTLYKYGWSIRHMIVQITLTILISLLVRIFP